MENPKDIVLMFNTIYINSVYANEEDKKRFISDYKLGNVVVKQAYFDKENQMGIIQTF